MKESIPVQKLPDDPARLAALCALWQGSGRDFWITLQGGSMTPTYLPGSHLRIQCSYQAVRANDVVVFRDEARLVAHRVVKIVQDTGGERQVVCLGDGNVFPDAPVPESAVLGIVVGSAPIPFWKRIAFVFLHPRRHGRYVLRRLRRAASAA